MGKSIIQEEKECWFCLSRYNLHRHHIFYGTANRKKSEKYGLTVYLCASHHNMSGTSVHFNKNMDNKLKQTAQTVFEEKIGSRDYFRQEFGKSYL